MNEEQASQGLYGWLVRTILSERLPGSGREMIMLGVLSVLVLGLEIGALVSMMMLFSSLFATESVPMEHTLSIPQWMALLLAIYVARGIFTYILQTARHDMARRWAMRFAGKATQHVLRLPLETHRRWDLSNLMPVLIFCGAGLDDLVESSVIALPLDAISTVAVITFLSFYQPELTIILVAVYLSYAIPYFAWKGREEEIASIHQQQANSLFDSITQALVGIREIKVFRAVATWMKRFASAFSDLEQSGKESSHLNERDQQTQMFIFTASGTLVILGAVLFFLAPALKTDADRMALTGQVFVFVLAQSLLSTPLIGLMGAARSFRQAAPQLTSLRQILAEPEEVESTGYTGDLAGFGTLEVKNATVLPPGSTTPALNAVDATIREGTLVALVGSSGSGKSTFLDLLTRFSDPEPGGEVKLGDRNLKDIELTTLRSTICVASQRPILFGGTIRTNLEVSTNGTFNEPSALGALRQAQIDMVGDPRFAAQGLETAIKDYGQNFSGGEAQRIALARVLLAKPQILVLDEATSALDPLTEARFFKSLADNRGKQTVLAVTHRLYALTPLADYIFVFDQGKIIQRGTHAELASVKGLYADLWETQIAAVREELKSLQELASAGKVTAQ